MTIDDRIAWTQENGIRLKQNLGELRAACAHLDGLSAATFLEVGALAGATLYIYAGLCAPGAQIVAVDIPHPNIPPDALPRVAEKLRGEGFRVALIRESSALPRTIERVADIFTEPINLLHIDGDHSYSATLSDAGIYSREMRDGGAIVFHDAALLPGPRAVYESIYPRGTRERFGSTFGIGVVRVAREELEVNR